MIKLEFVLKNGELAMDVYNDINGLKCYDFTKEDWDEVKDLMLAVDKYVNDDGDVDNG